MTFAQTNTACRAADTRTLAENGKQRTKSTVSSMQNIDCHKYDVRGKERELLKAEGRKTEDETKHERRRREKDQQLKVKVRHVESVSHSPIYRPS